MKLYVSNLAWAVNDGELKELFSNYGTVIEAKVVVDRATNKSKGFGFVTMPDDHESKEAMERLNKTEFRGRLLNVQESISKSRDVK